MENSLSQNHNYDYVVLEISSFQAEDIISFKPNIAIILNLSEDHLDIHDTYDSYKNAKLNLFKNMDKEDFAIYNLDDKNLNQKFMLLCGFEKFNNYYIRIDILERLFVQIINSDIKEKKEIKMVPEMLNLLGDEQ